MPHVISISDDTADRLMRDILIQDWQGLRQDIKTLSDKAAQGTIEDYEREDLATDQRFAAAMEIMLEYYLPAQQLNQLLSQDG